MAKGSDQVFQLSLTEIAFMVSFILLLLLGYLVFREQSARERGERELAEVRARLQAADTAEAAKLKMREALAAAGAANPDDIISKLIASERKAQNDAGLHQHIVDLEATISALEEIRRMASDGRRNEVRSQVEAALVLQEEARNTLMAMEGDSQGRDPAANWQRVRQVLAIGAALTAEVREQLGRKFRAGGEKESVKEIVAAAKSAIGQAAIGAALDGAKKENADLRGQVAFYKNKLDARGGRDYPPCWADESGKIEFVLAVELRPETVTVKAAWPSRREMDARSIEGVTDLLTGPLSYSSFTAGAQRVLDWSKRQDPQCRHYVELRSAITDAVQSDRARLMVENYFYKTEVRR
jgi:hypothetical protein